MGKYFLTNYNQLPEETREKNKFIKYVNLSILLLLLLIKKDNDDDIRNEIIYSNLSKKVNLINLKKLTISKKQVENNSKVDTNNAIQKKSLTNIKSEKKEKVIIRIKKSLTRNQMNGLLMIIFNELEDLNNLYKVDASIDIKKNEISGVIKEVHINGVKKQDIKNLLKRIKTDYEESII